MKIRGLLVATVVLAVLAGVLYWSDHRKSSAEAAKPAEATPSILKLDENSITKLELKKKDAPAIVLANNGADWQITEPKPFSADQSTVSTMVESVASLNSERMVDEKDSNPQRYGLEPPALELDITQKDNETRRLLLGDDTPTGGALYAALAGDPRVFTIPEYKKGSIDKSLNDLRDKRLLTVNTAKIASLELAGKNGEIEFAHTKDGWQILKPKPMRTDGSAVSELVEKLTDARMDLSGSDTPKETESAFARGTPVATVKVKDESSTQELQIRKSKDSYYVTSSVVAGAYKVGSDLGDAVNKKVDDFRNKKLFDFGYADPNKIEIHSGSNTYSLRRGGQDWWDNGKKMDESSVESVISDLRDLSADKFVDSGFTSPEIEANVTSDDGKRTEKVLISKSGSNYIAKRDNEPALYQLADTAVEDMQKSVEQIKPAAPVNKSGK
jgi:hypothetical protein